MQKQAEQDEDAADDQDDALNNIRPDDCGDAAEHGVDYREDSHAENDRSEVPSGQNVQRDRRRDERDAEIKDAVGEKSEGRVEFSTESEALSDVLVRAHTHNAAVEGNDNPRHHQQHDGHGHVGDEKDESLLVGRARMADDCAPC
ncbi:MAG: hypothetical protein HS122_08050 [Opitutaceae bacterium]|nr:hypothetical protein [Opitutaceae bacterium]